MPVPAVDDLEHDGLADRGLPLGEPAADQQQIRLRIERLVLDLDGETIIDVDIQPGGRDWQS